MASPEDSGLSPLTIGWIPYHNLRPLRHELVRAAGDALHFRKGHPTEVNKMLIEQRVPLAPSSSVCLLKNASLELALPIGVACSGPIQSVYLGLSGDITHIVEEVRVRLAEVNEIIHHAQMQYGDQTRQMANFIWSEIDELRPLEADLAPRLRLTSHSASSVALSKIFYRMVFGRAAYEQQVSNHYPSNSGLSTLELVIGDEALDRAPEFSKVIDLGLFWKSVTNLPFVFAVWQTSGKPVDPEWAELIMNAASSAEAHMHVEPADYFPPTLPMSHSGQEIDLAAYWRCIHYRLGPKDIQSLLLFLCLARPLIRVEMDDNMIVRMRRWQEMSATPMI